MQEAIIITMSRVTIVVTQNRWKYRGAEVASVRSFKERMDATGKRFTVKKEGKRKSPIREIFFNLVLRDVTVHSRI